MPRPISLLFDNAARAGGSQFAFANPIAEIRADRTADVDRALAAADAEIARGRWVAGYFSYELGYALEPKLAALMPPGAGPLLRLFVFDRPRPAPPLRPGSGARAQAIDPGAHWPAYRRAFDRAHRYILDGDIYQVNLAFPMEVTVPGEAAALYAALRLEARAGASAFLQLGDEDILSFSPETFFTAHGTTITTRPMKGTAPRGLTAADDLRAKRRLRADPKERAENLMIVDLLRNDLSRIATPGSVRVTDLFTVETFPRLHTMTSGVTANLRPDVSLSGIIGALFPCGSITGAPKVRAMEIVRELEPGARGPYCGAIGFAGPGFAAFNVAIRTLTIRNGKGVFHAGSGVVSDSEATLEFRECLLKAQFLERQTPAFGLIETIGWTREGGAILGLEHERRAAESAAYFGFPYAPLAMAAAIDMAAHETGADTARVRLGLQPDGGVSFSAAALTPSPSPAVWRYEIARDRIASQDPFRHHKTTQRQIYDDALRDARTRGVDEVVFLNERGEIAEGAISTLFVEIDDVIATPPLSSGALDGCLRQAVLDLCPSIVERPLTPSDLTRACSLWFGNSVRGFMRGVEAN